MINRLERRQLNNCAWCHLLTNTLWHNSQFTEFNFHSLRAAEFSPALVWANCVPKVLLCSRLKNVSRKVTEYSYLSIGSCANFIKLLLVTIRTALVFLRVGKVIRTSASVWPKSSECGTGRCCGRIRWKRAHSGSRRLRWDRRNSERKLAAIS